MKVQFKSFNSANMITGLITVYLKHDNLYELDETITALSHSMKNNSRIMLLVQGGEKNDFKQKLKQT